VKRTVAALVVALVVAACSDSSPSAVAPLSAGVSPTIVSGDVIVTNSNDDGPGSFRDAIDQAIASSTIDEIGFAPEVNTIALQSGIVFSGTQNLTINANHATLDASGAGDDVSAFVTTGGGNLTLIGLTVANADGQGVEVQIPVGKTGTVFVALTDVNILNNTGHGLLVQDQVLNSAASLNVSVTDSRVAGNGFSVSDRDGVRVNEGGVGALTFSSWNSRMEDNAADGIELDETGTGDVTIDVFRTQLLRNGIFDPADLDDGFDIDEAGDGNISGQVVSSAANHNYEQGLDFNENDAGDIRVNLTDVQASYNLQEGIEYEEDDDFAGGGGIVTTMDHIQTIGNGGGLPGTDAGLKIREKSTGNLDATLSDIIASQNIASGIQVEESGSGTMIVRIDKALTNANTAAPAPAVDPDDAGYGHGIEILGTVSTIAPFSTFSNIATSTNRGSGLFVNAGTVNLTNVKGGGNGAGLTGGAATFVEVP